jgi:hypothetical protein
LNKYTRIKYSFDNHVLSKEEKQQWIFFKYLHLINLICGIKAS